MKQINRWGITTGLVALLGIAASVTSCGEDKKGATGVGGSTAATGGASSDSGGSGQGGVTGATGGNTSTTTTATGGGGNSDSGTTTGCHDGNTDEARSDGLIADFSGSGADAGIQVIGGISTYGGDGAPDAEISGGALHIMQDASATDANQYVGTVLYFNNCVDATEFAGVQFTISGTMAGCTMQYSTNHSAANDVNTDAKGSCTLGSGQCYSPQKTITISETETEVQVAWTGGGLAAGSPNVPVDPTQLTGIQWQFTIPSGSGTCDADITIKNVKFYK